MPGSNLITTLERPSSDIEIRFLKWLTVPTASSMGLLTCASTSSGGMPPLIFIKMDISPKLKLGKSSMGRRARAMAPTTTIAENTISIVIGRFTARRGNPMIFN